MYLPTQNGFKRILVGVELIKMNEAVKESRNGFKEDIKKTIEEQSRKSAAKWSALNDTLAEKWFDFRRLGVPYRSTGTSPVRQQTKPVNYAQTFYDLDKLNEDINDAAGYAMKSAWLFYLTGMGVRCSYLRLTRG